MAHEDERSIRRRRVRREVDLEDFNSIVRQFVDAPEEESQKALLRIYEHPVMQSFAEILLSDPQEAWKKQMAEKYEQFLFRKGAMSINLRSLIAKWKRYTNADEIRIKSYSERGETEIVTLERNRLNREFVGLETYLQWARRFNRLVPKNWWDPGSFSYHTRFRPDMYGQIPYDFELAGALDFQLSQPLIDGAVSLGVGEVGLTQMLDGEQIGVLFYQKHPMMVSTSELREKLWPDEPVDERADAIAKMEKNFETFKDNVVRTQQTRGVAKLDIELGLQTYQQFREGTITPEALERLRARFVPEYLPTVESLRRPGQ